MRMLLDTCTLLWLGSKPDSLSDNAQAALAGEDPELFFSSISALEIGIKYRKGKLVLPEPADRWFSQLVHGMGAREIPIDISIAFAAASLEWDHRDPADRIIVATALREGMAVVTSDTAIANYHAVQVIW
jgi:PIN domain nuclease of toxin-antitoxin system